MPLKFPPNIKSFRDDLSKVALTEEDIRFIISRCLKSGANKAEIVRNWNLNLRTVYRWIDRSKKGIPLSPPDGPRPGLTEEDHADLRKFTVNKAGSGAGSTLDDVREKLVEKLSKNAAKHGQAFIKDISKRSVVRYANQAKVKGHSRETGYAARLEAEFEVKNCLSTCVLFHAILRFGLVIYLLVNYDATQFIISNYNAEKQTVMISEEYKPAKGAPPVKAPPQSKSSSLDYGIKWFCIAAGGGQHCPELVFLIADPSMAEGDFKYYEVKHLSAAATAGAKGYVCFTKTRGGNAQFFKWLNEGVVIPFIQMLKAQYGSDDSFVFLNMDGEAAQVNPYLDPEIRKAFDDLKVIIGKLAASCTALTQMCDAWKIFSSLKHWLGLTTRADAESNLGLKAALKEMLKQHEAATGHEFKADDKARIVLGLLKLKMVIELKFTVSLVKNSWAKVGFSEREGRLHFDIDTMLRQFNVRPTTFEYTNIMANLERACKIFLRKGRLTDLELRKLFCIVANKEALSVGAPEAERDALILSRQRCVLLMHDSVASRHLARIQDGKDKKIAKDELLLMGSHDTLLIEKARLAAVERARKAAVRVANQEKKKRKLEEAEAEEPDEQNKR